MENLLHPPRSGLQRARPFAQYSLRDGLDIHVHPRRYPRSRVKTMKEEPLQLASISARWDSKQLVHVTSLVDIIVQMGYDG